MTKSDGTRCNAKAKRGGELCNLHSDPIRAKEIQRRGGLNRRPTIEEGMTKINVKTPGDALQLLEVLIGSTLTNKLDVRSAGTIGQLIRVWAEVYRESVTEDRIQKIESRLTMANL